MPQGTVKKIHEKGFGFIDCGSGKDVFFHVTGLQQRTDFETLEAGDQVEFQLDESGDRPRATAVRKIR